MYIAGVDIGGTAIKFGVVDDNYEFVFSEMFPPVLGDPHATVQRIVKAMRECPVPIMRIGVGTAGLVDTRDHHVTAVNLGWDTDTVGAVAGGLAGLYYGYDAIPADWLAALKKRDWIEKLCDAVEIQ